MNGFTLIEAMVALVMFAVLGGALFSWINNTLASIERIEVAEERYQHTANALQYIQSINPMREPDGETQIGTLQMSWTSTLVEPVKDSISRLGAITLYSMGLYDVQVALAEPAGFSASFIVRQVGYQQVRSHGEQ